MHKKHLILLVLTGVFLAALMSPGTVRALNIERISGADRFETSVNFSKRFFGESSVTTVVISGGYGTETGGVAWSPDVACAASLASFLQSPLLLTRKDAIPPAINEELKRLNPEEVILVGGWGAISENVARSLVDQGFKVRRIWGVDRYHTSAMVAQFMAIVAGKSPEGAIIVTGENFPDTISAAYLSGSNGWPLLLTKKNNLPFPVRAALNSLNISKTLVIGGEGAVAETVATSLPQPERIAGKNRYETSLKVAEYAIFNLGFSTSSIFLVSGLTFADGIVASPCAGRKGICVLLVSQEDQGL